MARSRIARMYGWFLAFALALASAQAGATIVYSTLESSYSAGNYYEVRGFSAPPETHQAVPFTPSDSYLLDQVDVAISNIAGPAGLNVTITDDSAGLPGTALATRTIFAPGSPDVVPADFGGTLTLNSGQQYWVTLNAANNNVVDGWHWNGGLLSGTYADAVSGGPWTSHTGTLAAVRVEGTLVPEPATLLLAGLCAFGGFIARRRARGNAGR